MSEIPMYDENESRPDSPVAGGANPIEDDNAAPPPAANGEAQDDPDGEVG